jgi:peptidoglycan/LPS O-acetylase OafA/YrhL
MTVRRNSFDVIRLVAAGMVLYGHSFVAAGFDQPRAFAGTVGSLGVAIFFATSGYLISASWQADPRLGVYIWKRCLRILPALVPLAIVLALVGYLGVFDGNPRTSLNVSLWTLPVEARCYLLVAALGLLGILHRPKVTFAIYVVLVVLLVWQVYALGPLLTPKSAWFAAWAQLHATAFVGGMLMHRAPRRWSLALVAAAMVVALPAAFWALAIPYLVVYVGESVEFALRRDLSYGLYLWGWPVQQAIVALGVAAPAAIFPLALATGSMVALGSWLAIERPALMLKSRRLRMLLPVKP